MRPQASILQIITCLVIVMSNCVQAQTEGSNSSNLSDRWSAGYTPDRIEPPLVLDSLRGLHGAVPIAAFAGRLYLQRNHLLICVDAENGHEVWNLPSVWWSDAGNRLFYSGGKLICVPSVNDDQYHGRYIVVVNPANGKIDREINVGKLAFIQVDARERVFVGNSGRGDIDPASEAVVTCIDVGSGRRLWKSSILSDEEIVKRTLKYNPQLTQSRTELQKELLKQTGIVLFAADDEKVYGALIVPGPKGRVSGGVVFSIQASDGSVLWTREFAGSFVYDPWYRFFEGKLYLTIESVIYCIDAVDGSILWQRQSQGSVKCIAPGLVFVVEHGVVKALDSKSGSVKWETKSRLERLNQAFVCGDVLFVWREWRIESFRTSEGSLIWEKYPFADAPTQVIVYGSRLFFNANSWSSRSVCTLVSKAFASAKEEKRGLAKPPPISSKPPSLDCDLEFSEPSGNNFLDAEETGELHLVLTNTGRGDAFGVQVKLTPQADIAGVTFASPPAIAIIPAGQKEAITVPITASQAVASKQVRLKIEATEANGFDLDPPAYITFNTKQFLPPELTIADVGVNDQSGNGQIEPREIVEITARVQNRGQGDARDVSARLEVGENVFLTPDSKTEFSLGNLPLGAFKDVTFSVFTNTKATGVPVSLFVKEARGRYDKKLPLELAFNKPQKKATELVVEGKETSPREIGSVSGLSVDVDVNIPKTKLKNPDAVAVVIGITRYKNQDVPSVDYAKHGAAVMKEYLVNTLGFDESRIISATDDNASLSDFKRIFEEQLRNWTRAGKSDVFVYYNGHGAPDPETKEAFFVPYDCNPTFAKSTGYPVKEIYSRLAKLPARSVTIVLDACFSGSTPKGMLLKQVSPVLISVQNPVFVMENAVLFSSSTGQQLSNWYPEKRHGLFTYYFLKGLRGDADRNGDSQVTVEEMEQFLLANIPDQARYLNNREQTPQVMGKEKSKVLVKY